MPSVAFHSRPQLETLWLFGLTNQTEGNFLSIGGCANHECHSRLVFHLLRPGEVFGFVLFHINAVGDLLIVQSGLISIVDATGRDIVPLNEGMELLVHPLFHDCLLRCIVDVASFSMQIDANSIISFEDFGNPSIGGTEFLFRYTELLCVSKCLGSQRDVRQSTMVLVDSLLAQIHVRNKPLLQLRILWRNMSLGFVATNQSLAVVLLQVTTKTLLFRLRS
ncbi:expressed unknown protein [Seminavis robusta]|uniref:Uncharacterized protein n=1 Tax=Seminavis robusta TaxID=568900 RepID=A0A9N8HIG6_9STRA|nr:expressed unknown protein [Seminavis robusta]|eukprot:Sro499_g155171.1  (221) ;mRNA; r:56285-56947